MVGAIMALVLYAPARWLSQAISDATQGRVLLAEPEGSILSGSGVLVLAGGPGSRESRRLPHRLSWKMGPFWGGSNLALRLRFYQPCCIKKGLVLELAKNTVEWTLAIKIDQSVKPPDFKIIELPVGILAGLGMPWNGFRLEGDWWLTTNDWVFTFGKSGVRAQGTAQMGFNHVRTSLTTLESLGSYRMALDGHEHIKFTVQSDVNSALNLEGSGEWSAVSGLRVRARAAINSSHESVLGQFLNIIGPRQGNQVLISLG